MSSPIEFDEDRPSIPVPRIPREQHVGFEGSEFLGKPKEGGNGKSQKVLIGIIIFNVIVTILVIIFAF